MLRMLTASEDSKADAWCCISQVERMRRGTNTAPTPAVTDSAAAEQRLRSELVSQRQLVNALRAEAVAAAEACHQNRACSAICDDGLPWS